MLGNASHHRIAVNFQHAGNWLLIASSQIPDQRNADVEHLAQSGPPPPMLVWVKTPSIRRDTTQCDAGLQTMVLFIIYFLSHDPSSCLNLV